MSEINNKHDRTILFGETYLKDPTTIFTKKVMISGDSSYLETENGKLTIKTLFNLTCRYLDRIYIDKVFSDKKLQEEIEVIAKRTKTELIPTTPDEVELIISVGNISKSEKFTITIGSDGWVSFLACNNNIPNLPNARHNPIGAMGAAVFGSAEAFKRILEISGSKEKEINKHPSNYSFSFLDYTLSENNDKFPTSIEISDKVLLVGGGAVGSAFTYAISNISDVSGHITVIDDERFERTNLNRCVICYEDTIDEFKSDIVQKYSNETLKFSSFVGTFREYTEKTEKIPPIVISTVDNNDARFQIQSELPKLIFHGATGKNISAISIIKFLENACLGCIFENTSPYEENISKETGIPLEEVKQLILERGVFSEDNYQKMVEKLGEQAKKFQNNIGQKFSEFYIKEVCGQITTNTNEGMKSPSVSFVSFFSGLVLVSELIKYYNSQFTNIPMKNNLDFLQFNLFIPTLYHMVRRPKNKQCMFNCFSTDIQEIFAEKWNLSLIKRGVN